MANVSVHMQLRALHDSGYPVCSLYGGLIYAFCTKYASDYCVYVVLEGMSQKIEDRNLTALSCQKSFFLINAEICPLITFIKVQQWFETFLQDRTRLEIKETGSKHSLTWSLTGGSLIEVDWKKRFGRRSLGYIYKRPADKFKPRS